MTCLKNRVLRLTAACMSITVWVGLIAVCPEPARAQPHDQQTAPAPHLFQMPEYALLQQALARPVLALLRQQKFAKAEKALRQLIARYSIWPGHHYMLAAALAMQDKPEDALKSLRNAMERGYSQATLLQQDPSFKSLHGQANFQSLLSEMKLQRPPPIPAFKTNAVPRAVTGGRALVDEANTVWERRGNLLVSLFQFPAAQKPELVYVGRNPVLQLLNRWHRDRTSAGNYGDLYDNRDNRHSVLQSTAFPQLAQVKYSKPAKAARRHYGVNSNQLFNSITVGNSSTAITGAGVWRSQARFLLTTPRLAARAYLQYANNHLYIYPEHRDHDPKNGDLFPANTPYILISQGSSGSDRPFLNLVAALLAAFPPDVKAWLKERKLIAPTLQLIIRSGLKSVRSLDDYLSAKAHPTVFDAAEIDLERMLRFARDLRADVVPPVVLLKVQKESRPTPGINYFGPSVNDGVLFNTPSAIARIHRSTAQERRMVVSADGTKDPNGRPLRFVWKLLRGDPGKVSIKPLSANGSSAEIRIKWHDQGTVPFNDTLKTNRVDIGVFAHNGANYSSPAFVSVYHPPNQLRTYGERGQIVSVAYDAKSLSGRYADPALFAKRAWQDHYEYTEQGQLLGWVRKTGPKTQRYTRHGGRVVALDRSGRPIRAELISYRRTQGAKLRRSIQQVPAKRFVHYRYETEADLLGRASLCNQSVCPHD